MKLPLLLVLWTFSLISSAAYADTIKNYYYEGVFNNGTTGIVSGSITIDTTTGVVADGSPIFLTYPAGGLVLGPYPIAPPVIFYDPGSDGFASIDISLGVDLPGIPPPGSPRGVDLVIQGTTLVDYNGTVLCTVARPCLNGMTSTITFPGFIFERTYDFTSATFSTVPPVPEPSTLAMLATGAFAFAGAARRRLGDR
jgi:hypothetical protein